MADANEAAAKGGRNAMAKLESRIREMEIELGNTQSKTSDAYKSFQKSERRIKELQFQQDEDKKNQDAMSELAQKLQLKIKTYKKQIEEAEEIADNSVSLHEFTRTLHETLSSEAKNEIIEMLWRLALIDDSLDRYEDYLVRKIADLLYVSNSNVLRIKHELTSN